MTYNQLMLTDSMLDSLRKTRPWVMFLAVLGFVFTGFAVLAGIFMLLAFSIAGALPHQPGMPQLFGTAIGIVFGILYLVMAVFLYLWPCIILTRYAGAITRLSGDQPQAAMEAALLQQKAFWKYLGILMIVALVLYLLAMVGGIVAVVAVGIHAVR